MIKWFKMLMFVLGVYIVLFFAFFTWPFSAFWGRTIRKLIKWHDRS